MNELTKASKYLSFILRHQPQAIDLALNNHGWASIDELLSKTTDIYLTRELLQIVVETNSKQRFAISDDGLYIRANQGHSIAVDLALKPSKPPSVLLHGTAERFLPMILREGLVKGERHHVHLTESYDVARAVGARYGKPVILQIQTQPLVAQNIDFFKTPNLVWLVNAVPPTCLTVL